MSDPFANLTRLVASWPEPPDIVPLRILGLNYMPTDRAAVKQAFRFKMFAAHPDVNPDTASAQDDVQELVWARDVLLRKIPPPVTADDLARRDHASRNGYGTGPRNPHSYYGPRCIGCLKVRHLQRYGRWRGYCWRCKADAENVRQRDLRAQARADRKCEGCGATFTPKRADGRFCSNACRQAMHRRRRKDTQQ